MPVPALPVTAVADGLDLWDAARCRPSFGTHPSIAKPRTIRKDYRYSEADQEWVECAMAVRQHDKTILENWNREMDTQLLFSSLFSGIVAGFLLAATDLVRVDGYASMHAKLTSIAANVLWFGSLIISLNSVLSAILVKQWLLEYVWEHDGASNLSPKLSFAVRHLRFQNLHGSNIPLYIDYLPLQMVVGVGTFFAGLLAFMWGLNTIVACIGSILIVVSLSQFFTTAALPLRDPLSPYQSVQAWLFRRLNQKIRGDGQATPCDGWVGETVRDIKVKPDVAESHGLVWLHRDLKLGLWKSKIIKQSLACALSLHPVARTRTAVALCADYMAPVFLDSTTDVRKATEFLLRFCDTVGERLFKAVFAVLLEDIPVLFDGSTVSPPVEAHELLNATKLALLLIQHPEWVQETKPEAWGTMLSLTNSLNFLDITDDDKMDLKKWILSGFLQQALLSPEEDGHQVPLWKLREDQVQLIFVAMPWAVVPFDTAQPAYHEEKSRNWTLSISCFLFGLLNFKIPVGDENKNTEDIVHSLRAMSGYLKQKRDGKEKNFDLEFAVALWTRVLSHRPILGAPVMQFLRRGRVLDDDFYVALRDLLDAMEEVMIQSHSSTSLDECKESVWALRLLAGKVSTIHTLFRNYYLDDPKAAFSNEPPTSLSTRISKLTAQELLSAGETMLSAFPMKSWSEYDLDDNYRHALITCFVFHVIFAHDTEPELLLRSEPVDYSLHLVLHAEGTISMLPEAKRRHLETIIARLLSRYEARWRTLKHGEDDGFHGAESTRSLLLDIVAKKNPEVNPRLFLDLSSLTLGFLVPWTRCHYLEYPVMQSVLDSVASFLDTAKPLGIDRSSSWVRAVLVDIRGSMKANSDAWGPETLESAQRFMQALKDMCDYQSWSDEERKALVDVLRESKGIGSESRI